MWCGGMTEKTRICTNCGMQKSRKDFYKATRTRCKECERAYSSVYGKTHRDERTKNEIRSYRCAKVFCPSANPQQIIHLICKVCGKEYGMMEHRYRYKMSLDDTHHPKYCSSECQHIGLSKKWQQIQSPYAKKIKELQKVYK